MLALIYASIGIIIYVSLRFEWRMGLSSVLALLHDVFIIVAIFSLFRIEVDLTFIAAVLTIVGYSINDTIVTFDRVRENLQKVKVITTTEQIDDIVNRSIRQTMTRSINTVLTVIVVVVAILFFGAPYDIQLYFSIIYRIDFWCILFNLHCRSALGNNEKTSVEKIAETQISCI